MHSRASLNSQSLDLLHVESLVVLPICIGLCGDLGRFSRGLNDLSAPQVVFSVSGDVFGSNVDGVNLLSDELGPEGEQLLEGGADQLGVKLGRVLKMYKIGLDYVKLLLTCEPCYLGLMCRR